MKKKSIFKVCLAAALLSVSVSSCDVLSSVANQLVGLANLANCEYSLKDVTNIYVAGVNVSNITNGNISTGDVVKLTTALVAKKVPVTMDFNVNIKNPSTSNASLTAMDWICEIDGKQFATGNTTRAYTITPNSTTAVPLTVSADIYSIFSQGGIEALKNFVSSFAADGTSSKVAFKIKPSVNVGGVDIPTNNYITIQKNTGGNNTGSSTNTSTNSSSNNNNNSGSNNGGNSGSTNNKVPPKRL